MDNEGFQEAIRDMLEVAATDIADEANTQTIEEYRQALVDGWRLAVEANLESWVEGINEDAVEFALITIDRLPSPTQLKGNNDVN